jgi:hypothetical protein
MKLKACCCILVALVIPALHAADEKDLPPGLRKKDKLPPGWEKKGGKRGNEAEPAAAATNVNKAPTSSDTRTAKPADAPVVSAPAPTSPAPVKAVRSPQQVKASIDKHIQSMNTLDNKAPAKTAGFAAIAKETGVPAATIQAQHREHPGIGSGGLLMANLIAAQTKKPATTYMRQRLAGKSWEAIAAANQVTLENADGALERVEAAMHTAK